MATEIQGNLQTFVESLTNIGIEPANAASLNGTKNGLESSLPELYKYVSLPEEPRKFLSFPGRYNGTEVFVKALYKNTPDFREQIVRESIAAQELNSGSTNPKITPELLEVIDTDEFFVIIYECLGSEFSPLQVPFLPENKGSSKELLNRFFGLMHEWVNLGKNSYTPSNKLMLHSGYNLDANKYTPPSSIKGLSGMSIEFYQKEFRTLLKNANIHFVEEFSSEDYRLESSPFKVPHKYLKIISNGLKILAKHDFNFNDGYALVHNDLGPQNIMNSEVGQMLIIDLENLTVAPNRLLGCTADLAHFTSRLWYNSYWQEMILDKVNEAENTEYKVAFYINLALEALRRVTRPINYYSCGYVDNTYQFAPEMVTFSRIRIERNIELLKRSIFNLDL